MTRKNEWTVINLCWISFPDRLEFNSRGTEIFPFSYFENPWLECDLVIKDNKEINIFHKTRTYGLNLE